MPEDKRTNLSDILHGYYQTIGKDPRLQIPVYTIGGGLAGHYGSKVVTNMLINLALAEKPAAEREMILRKMHQTGHIDRLSTILGAVGGGLFAANQHWDTGSGIEGFLQSLTNPKYWDEYPGRMTDEITKGRNKTRDTSYKSQTWNPLQKVSSENFGGYPFKDFLEHEDYTSAIIPVKHSVDLVEKDRYLNPFQKSVTSDIIKGAEYKPSGLISRQQLAKSAFQAGAGFVPAYLFGHTVGGLLSMPTQVTERFSKIGGLAGAVINTGIFRD